MKRLLYLFVFGCSLSLSTQAAEPVDPPASDSYFIDDQKVEQLFTNSVDISLTNFNTSLLGNNADKNGVATNAFYAAGDKTFITALLLNIFLGVLGIHRAYLGTKTLTWVGYILTCGGIFGIVPLIDFIVLIINNDDISPYVDNPKFFMWGGSM